MAPEQLQKMIKTVLSFDNMRVPEFARRLLLADRIRAHHETAKKALIAAGRDPAKIEQWPHLQVAFLDALLEYDQVLDEAIRLQAQPFWEAAPVLEQMEKRSRNTVFRAATEPALPLAPLVLPAMSRVMQARVRLDRQLAAFQCLEAIRLYAAQHKGQLPAALADIKDVPVPMCPVTDRPFVYRRTGSDTATLAAPSAPKSALSIRPPSYDLTIRR